MLVAFSCSTDEGADTTGSAASESSTTGRNGQASPSTGAKGGSNTIESIIGSVQAELDNKFAASDPPPKVLVAFECRDLLSTDVDTSLFSAVGRPPADGFFWSLVYWSLEGQPDRMDAGLNGIPCETLYEPDVVSAVLAEHADG